MVPFWEGTALLLLTLHKHWFFFDRNETKINKPILQATILLMPRIPVIIIITPALINATR